LDKTHVDWLNNYNAWVYEKLASKLTTEEQAWLAEKTKVI
jgi:Xaa-Pro aminopeptidase